MMRKLLFLLPALVLTTFSADAQTPSPQHGFKAGYVAAVGSGEVAPDQMDNFKKYAKGCSRRWLKNRGRPRSSSASSQTGRPSIS